ncbi:MAG TPA: Na+/H+ antiporter NhaA [Polyangiaceae bacterium]
MRAPVERFLAIEAASGIVLLAAAALALLWANSPWRESYQSLFHTQLAFELGPFRFARDLHFWINDGLMTIFFFVVGLEIRREIHRGELSELRRAMLPIATAVGGMLVPAAIYLALNAGRPTASGWGVPMATDIAFAVGVLALLGNRVPPALRVLLLALAVIDDVGAILVIAFFYSSGLDTTGFGVMALGIATLLAMQKIGFRSPWAYVPPAGVAWAGAYASGIHPTLAGVIVGLMTPARAWFGAEGFLAQTETNLQRLRKRSHLDEPELLPHLDAMDAARREAVSPVERLQHALHGWVAFGVMPLFALANAGVPLGNTDFTGDNLWVFLGVLLGLTIGKPVGVVAVAWITTRFGVAALPRGVTWSQVLLVGIVAGIGFTMSLFIAGLAFQAGPALETVKLGILCASAVAALLGFVYGLKILPRTPVEGAARTSSEAESSTIA